MAPKQEIAKLFDLINEIKTELKTKASDNKLEELKNIITEKDRKIEIMESKIAILENTVNILKEKCDDNEQYSRRVSLRISNIPLPHGGKETAEQCMEKVKEVIREAGVVIPDVVLDRAHRVGRPKKDDDGSAKQQIIVRFTTWQHRTLLYKGRKNLANAKVYLDLTKTKFKLLKHCQAKVQDNNLVDFVFADVNCALCVRMKNGAFRYFNSENQLDDIVLQA